jgi:patatin-like phospholipase/acyl hydrolase
MSMSIYNKNILPDWNCGHKCEVNYKVHRSQTGVINIFFVQAKLNDLKNARLADVCIGTSAAPTFLPAHYFETEDAEGNTRSFDLIDGGVATNNHVSS